MKKTIYYFNCLFLLILGIALWGCEKDVDPISVASVTLDSTSMTLVEGDSKTLTATISPSNAENQMVLWISSDASVASVKDGVVTAIKPGNATITVKSDDGGKTATCDVTVVAKVYPVEKIALDTTSETLAEGEILILTATITPSNATNKNVTWKSSKPSIATVEKGEVKALKAGTTTITVTTEDGNKTATCDVTVIANVASVSLNKTEVEITEGDTCTLTATINPDNATNKNVSWESSNTSIATVSNGKVTALKAGTATITVTTEDGGKTATCKVVVNAKVIGISLDKSDASLYEGETITLTATINPDNAANKNVNWSSSNTSVATVSNGKVTALKAGTTTITATTEDGTKTATCVVTVKAKVATVSLNKTSLSLNEGETYTLVATIKPDNATNKNVTWSSSDSSIATVLEGKVTALKAGTTTITATTEDGNKTATCVITVKAKVVSVSLDKTELELTEGDAYTLKATINPDNAANKNVTWRSSNTSVATVVDGKVSALKSGSATITVTTEDGGKTATCKVIVNEKIYPVESISLDKTTAIIYEGEILSLVATINPSNATNKNVSWSSDNTSVATVVDGKVTALKAGTTTITVTTEDGNKTATCNITVLTPVESVILDKNSMVLTEGDTATLIATINPDNASNKNITWESSNISVATVVDGNVTALKAGTTTITVTTENGGKTATCNVTVNEKVYPVENISLDKTTVVLFEGEHAMLYATITPENATNKNVSWSSDNTSVATVSNGNITALKAGTTTITVTTEDGNKTATCLVTVKAKVASISLDKTTATLYEGETIVLTPTINPDNATNKNVTWSSSDSSVAMVSNGVVTALKAGTATIAVTTEDGGKTATCNVTVKAKVASVSLDKTELELTEGDVYTLKATINPDNATNKNITWESSNASVATVSNGKVTALKAGTATITVTTEDGGKTATCKVIVNEKVYPVTGISLNKTTESVVVGNKVMLIATITPSNATNKNVTWSSSDTSVATVSATGEVSTLSPGVANIVVTTEDGKYTAMCKITVAEKVVNGGNEGTSDEDWGI